MNQEPDFQPTCLCGCTAEMPACPEGKALYQQLHTSMETLNNPGIDQAALFLTVAAQGDRFLDHLGLGQFKLNLSDPSV